MLDAACGTTAVDGKSAPVSSGDTGSFSQLLPPGSGRRNRKRGSAFTAGRKSTIPFSSGCALACPQPHPPLRHTTRRKHSFLKIINTKRYSAAALGSYASSSFFSHVFSFFAETCGSVKSGSPNLSAHSCESSKRKAGQPLLVEQRTPRFSRASSRRSTGSDLVLDLVADSDEENFPPIGGSTLFKTHGGNPTTGARNPCQMQLLSIVDSDSYLEEKVYLPLFFSEKQNAPVFRLTSLLFFFLCLVTSST